jgi:hypothetical protein
MITIIHGEDTNASRNALYLLREKSQPLVLDGEKISLTDLTQVFDGGGLFATEQTIVIEQLLSKRKGTKEFETMLTLLQEHTLDTELYLWEGKELDKKALSTFPHATVKAYKLPQTLFLLLDSFRPGQGQKLVQLFHKTLDHAEVEMIFFMLVRQVRLLLALSDQGKQQIDEVKRLAPWQREKLQKQAKAFPLQKLFELHSQLFETEKQLKTGGLASDLSLAIDNLLLTI